MVKSAERTCAILEYIAQSSEGYTVAEICRKLDIPRNSATALLSTLAAFDYLLLEPRRKKYLLGPKVLILANRYQDNLDLAVISQPYLAKLAERTKESVALAVRRGRSILFVNRVNSRQPIIRPLQVGTMSPVYASAAGKAMMAYWPEEEIRAYLFKKSFEPITPKTVVDPAGILKEIDLIRQGGLGTCLEGLVEGVSAFSRPIFGPNGSVVGSLAVSMPSFRADEEIICNVAEALRDVSGELSLRLGFNPLPDRNGVGKDIFFQGGSKPPARHDGELPSQISEMNVMEISYDG
jgi:IclR family transcriptional regulator, KDG regulon repressor